jgi:O-antigen ligase
VALLLVVTLPFLGAHHYLPLTTFYQEWLAGMLGLISLFLLAFASDGAWSIPRIALLPLMLISLVWIQLAIGIDVLFEHAVLFSLYLGWAFILMLITSRLMAKIGRDTLANWFARALLIGSLLVAGTGVLQRWLPWIGLPYIFPSSESIRGNLAQASNFADYLWIGIVCALHLYGRGKLALVSLWLVLPVLIGLSLLSGARSVYIYAVALTIWYFTWALQSEGGGRRRLVLAAGLLLPTLLIVQTLLELQILQQGVEAPVSSAQRLVTQSSYDPVRMTLWRAALDIFSEHPLIGAGYDSFSREFYLRAERFPINRNATPEHSHNLLTEILAEFGLAGFSIMLGALVYWLVSLRLREGNGANHLSLGILIILGIHSSLEYPLWYAHFLAIAAIFLCIGDEHRWQLQNASWQRPILILIAISGMVALLNIRNDYTLLEKSANGLSLDGKPSLPAIQQEHLTSIYSKSLWRYYAALQLAARMPIEKKDVEARLNIVMNAAHFSPIRQAVFRKAALLQIAGHEKEAEMELQRAITSYPKDITSALMQMEEDEDVRSVLQPLIDRLRATL